MKKRKYKRNTLKNLFMGLFLLSTGSSISCDNAADPTPELSNTKKSVAILKAIQSGYVKAMQDFINLTTNTQHNLTSPDGTVAFIGAVQSRTFNGTRINLSVVL